MSVITTIKGINLYFKGYKYLTQYKSTTMLQCIITYIIKDSAHFQLVHASTQTGKFVSSHTIKAKTKHESYGKHVFREIRC
jgi:hypothetical protein